MVFDLAQNGDFSKYLKLNSKLTFPLTTFSLTFIFVLIRMPQSRASQILYRANRQHIGLPEIQGNHAQRPEAGKLPVQ